MPKKKETDDIDRKILEILQTKATITNRDLAKEIGLTPGPTLTRVSRLYENDYIVGSYAAINWEKLGYTYQAHVITSVYLEDAPAFEEAVKGVVGCMVTNQVDRDTKVGSKFKTYLSVCKFKSEQHFIDAWTELLSICKFPQDFQVWEVKQKLYPHQTIKLSMNDFT